DYDLTSMIWQAQSRIAFGVQGDDADILGHEFASLSYDPKRIKDTLYHMRQRIAGHEKITLKSWGDSVTDSESWDERYGKGWTHHDTRSKRDGSIDEVRGSGDTRAENTQKGKGGGSSRARNEGGAEHLVPIHEEVQELSSRTFYTGDEWERMWAKRARVLQTGVALVRLVDDPELYEVAVDRSAVGYLGWDAGLLRRKLPRVIDQVDAFVEENFRSEFFVRPEVIDAETEKRLHALLHAPIEIPGSLHGTERDTCRSVMDAPADKKNPFDDEKSP
ncbi:MAG: hypothetical protein M3N13_08390, partial [Candidatus Eremiobacteraeota bacterium]|nr:hypothetical protein [Candidatus Eremiobacteraeota bacterium]